jgi:hypothetical protein
MTVVYAWNAQLKASQGGDVPDFVWSYAAVTPCGSQTTNNPPPGLGISSTHPHHLSDWDYLVQVRPACSEYEKRIAMEHLVELLARDGWTWEGADHYREAALELTVKWGFMSWRKDRVNLIVVGHDEFALKHRLATRLCTKLNLPDRDDRVAVFQAIVYGECDVHVSSSGCQL